MLTAHALFDPASDYSRMRSGFQPGDKLRGHFHGMAHSVETVATTKAARGNSGAARVDPALAADSRANVELFSAPRSSIRRLSNEDASCGVSQRGGALFYVEVRGLPVRGVAARALVVSPAFVERMRRVEPALDPDDDMQAIQQAIEDEMLRNNWEMSRLLSAIPDVDGQVNEHGYLLLEAGVPDDSVDLPKTTRVVVVVDERAE